MPISKRSLSLLAAAALVVAVLIGFGTAATSGPGDNGRGRPPAFDRRPPVNLPPAAQEALDRGGAHVQVEDDFEAMARDLGLTGEAARAFVDRSRRAAAQSPPIVGEGRPPSEGKTPSEPPRR